MELSPTEKRSRLGLKPETCFTHLQSFEEAKKTAKPKPRVPTPPGQLMLNIVEAWQCISRKDLLYQMSCYMDERSAAICIEKATPRFVELGMVKVSEKVAKWKMTPVVERFLANRKDTAYFNEFSELLK